jgi:hypothetical protein
MAGWEKIAVSKLHRTGFNVEYANHAENKSNADKRKDYKRFSRHFGFSFFDKNLITFSPIQCSVLFSPPFPNPDNYRTQFIAI